MEIIKLFNKPLETIDLLLIPLGAACYAIVACIIRIIIVKLFPSLKYRLSTSDFVGMSFVALIPIVFIYISISVIVNMGAKMVFPVILFWIVIFAMFGLPIILSRKK